MKEIPSITGIFPFEDRLRVFALPAARVIGKSIRHENETSVAPIPLFWEEYHNAYEKTTDALPRLTPTTLALFGEYEPSTRAYTYMICVLCPAGTPVPEGFEYRDLPPMLLAHGPVSASPPDAHSTDRFTQELEGLGFVPGGDAGYGFECYPCPDTDACCVLFEVLEKKGDHLMEEKVQDLAALYPDITAPVTLPPLRVASYRHVSGSPEDEGRPIVMDWAQRRGPLDPLAPARVFGFDAPAFFAEVRGYEWWVTVPENFRFVPGEPVTETRMPGGLYARINIEYPEGDIGAFLGKLFGAKSHFAKWCRASGYGFGAQPYLEELLPAAREGSLSTMRLFFPLSPDASNLEPKEVRLAPFTGVVFKNDGQSCAGYDEALALWEAWTTSSHGLDGHRILTRQQSQNQSWGVPKEIWVTDPPSGAYLGDLIQRVFEGGEYLVFETLYTCMDSEIAENCYDIYQRHPRRDPAGAMLIEFAGLAAPVECGGGLLRLYYPLRAE